MEYKLRIENRKNESFSSILHERIREYNNCESPFHRKVREAGAVKYINIIVETENGKMIGGLTGEIYWGWLEINDFWLKEDYRKKGLGTRILKEAEQEAVKQGCNKAMLKTFEFQGREFYERNGYMVTGKLEDYPPGSTFYWMSKTLV